MDITRHAHVLAILADARFAVPGAPPGGAGVAWLRGAVARFSSGPDHVRRRALAVAELARIEPEALRQRSFERAPVEVLSEAMAPARITVDDVAAVAASYHPHTTITPAADAALARLVAAFGGTADEPTAARIGLLVQAHAATEDLIRNAAHRLDPSAPLDAILAETLRHDPPVRLTRRVAAAHIEELSIVQGTPVVLDLAAANRDPSVFDEPDRFWPSRPRRPWPARHLTFGAGPHACPGRDHAMAIAAGALDGSAR